MVEAPVVSLPPCNLEPYQIVFVPVTIREVSRIVMKSSTKVCALDPMPMWLLKELLLSIAPLMTDFINSYYRPVSNLHFVSKVLERVVASQLKAYMDYNDLQDLLQLA